MFKLYNIFTHTIQGSLAFCSILSGLTHLKESATNLYLRSEREKVTMLEKMVQEKKNGQGDSER